LRDRIVVVGASCSGKTTLSRQLAAILSAPHVELDAFYWNPRWTPTPADTLRQRVEQALSASRWVCDGNYSGLQDLVWKRATAVVWLNYSFPRVFGRAMGRTASRLWTGEGVCNGNRETLRLVLLSRNSIIWWVIRSYRGRQRWCREQFGSLDHAHLRLIELRHPRETAALVAEIRRDTSSQGV
jgi:adenylate kinase family enzyme